MGGGLMQLVAYGAQDIYLTGNPQITFFKIVYRRHTNFSMECIKQTISGSSTISDTYTTNGSVTITRNGDLLSQIYVSCDQDSTYGINGDYLIEDVEIEIGGQRIDKHYREWNQIWTELTTPISKSEGFKYMTGSFTNTLVTKSETSQQTIMYPLQFWFCRNIGLSLPIIALQYHDVKLKFTWGSGAASDGISRSGGGAVTPSLGVWADYIYLDTDERRRFAQVSHEYLIEQLQIQAEGTSRSSFKLNFDHPIKELIWTVPTSTTEANTVLSQQMKLELNGHDRLAFQDREYFQIKQPYIHHTSIPGFNIKEYESPKLLTKPLPLTSADGLNSSGVAKTPGEMLCTDASGDVNEKNEIFLSGSTLTIGKGTGQPAFDIRVGDVLKVSVNIKDPDSASNENETNLGLEAHSGLTTVTAIANNLDDRPSGNSSTYATITISPSLGILVTAKYCMVASVIGRTVNPMSRCSQLSRDIFVYSFALNPEEHQPSGTCNFSKIDAAKLLLSSPGTISNIYAVNYNVLRIMSGMGGLAYAI